MFWLSRYKVGADPERFPGGGLVIIALELGDMVCVLFFHLQVHITEIWVVQSIHMV